MLISSARAEAVFRLGDVLLKEKCAPIGHIVRNTYLLNPTEAHPRNDMFF